MGREKRGRGRRKREMRKEEGGSRMEKRFWEPMSSKANNSILIIESFKNGNYLGKSHIATILSIFFFNIVSK